MKRGTTEVPCMHCDKMFLSYGQRVPLPEQRRRDKLQKKKNKKSPEATISDRCRHPQSITSTAEKTNTPMSLNEDVSDTELPDIHF